MIRLFGLVALVLSVSGPVHAAQIEWWELRIPYQYKDLQGVCSEHLPSLTERMYLAAEVEGSTVKKAFLKSSSSHKSKGHELSAGELASLKVYQDEFAKAWLEEFTLEEPSLLWMANRLGNYFCKPPQPLVSLTQANLHVEFDTTKLGVEYLIALSDEFRLEGKRKDGEAFELEIQFEQRRYK